MMRPLVLGAIAMIFATAAHALAVVEFLKMDVSQQMDVIKPIHVPEHRGGRQGGGYPYGDDAVGTRDPRGASGSETRRPPPLIRAPRVGAFSRLRLSDKRRAGAALVPTNSC